MSEQPRTERPPRDPAAPLEGARIVVCVGGGIAAYKAAELVRLFDKAGARVDVAMTARAQEFVGPLTFQALTRRPVFTDLFSLTEEATIGHIQLADAADLVVVAPATATVQRRNGQPPICRMCVSATSEEGTTTCCRTSIAASTERAVVHGDGRAALAWRSRPTLPGSSLLRSTTRWHDRDGQEPGGSSDLPALVHALNPPSSSTMSV